jgi:hypothetical protein
MTRPPVKLPDGLHIGQRVRTSKRYAQVNPRACCGEGTIVGGSNGATGCVWIKLDGHRHPHQMVRNFFEVVG